MAGWRKDLLSATVVLLGLSLVGFAIAARSDSPRHAAAESSYAVRIPGIACDSCTGPSGSQTPTPSPTSSPGAGVSSFEVVFIDVGQGDATLITVGSQRLLIDAGRSGATIRTRLQSLGVTDLDAILATHPDADHIGGFTEVLSMFQVERVYLNGGTSTSQTYADFMAAVNAEGAQVVTVSRGQTISLGGLSLPVLNPGTLLGDSNIDSIVTRLTCGTVDVLFMGDAETPAESSMLSAGVLTDIDVLKVGHHGSDSGTSQAFVSVVKPEYAVISAGLNNQYGHPAPSVVARLQAAGAQILYTDTTAGDDSVKMTSNCQTFSFVGGGGPTATPTRTATSTPTPTATRSATATPTTTSGYSLPSCYVANQNTCNCSNFTTWGHAQWFHNNYDPNDVNKLDADNDGVVCESLPGAP